MVGRSRPEAPSASRGRKVAEALAQSWRTPEPPLWAPTRSELADVRPALIGSGSAALAWRRLRQAPASRSPAGFEMEQAYRLYAIEALVRERQLARVLARLRAAGVEPLLAGGWAAAAFYPEPGLRPYDQFEIYVGAGQKDVAADALREEPAGVTVSAGCPLLNDRPWSVLNERARTRALGTGHVRVFGPEDLLRLLALQMLQRGASRPVWLCDLAVGLESAGAAFDWDHFLSGHPRRTDWAAAALVLARELLGAEAPAPPPGFVRRAPPYWLVRTVLRQWSIAQREHPEPWRVPKPTRGSGLRALRPRWPNALEATVGLGAPFNAMPRLPLQVAACMAGAARGVLAERSLGGPSVAALTAFAGPG